MIIGPVVSRLTGVNLLSTGSLPLIPQQSSVGNPEQLNLLTQYIYAVVRTMTGPALSVSPKFRIGANGTHDDVAPLFTVSLGVQPGIFALVPSITFPLTPVDMRAGPVILEITQAGVGPTACTGDIVIVGMGISA